MFKKYFLFFILTGLLASLAHAGKPPVFATGDGAIRGHDPVAYFTAGKPTKGSDQHTFEWNGATFKFASAENRDTFAANPDKYAPQYGGYCAYTDPEAWSIYQDKLYLNYSLGVRKRWSEDIPGRVAKADKNWPGVLN